MEVIKDFILNHWDVLSSLVLLVISIILLCLKKKTINSIVGEIYELSVAAINDSELQSKLVKLSGDAKLAAAIQFVNKQLLVKYPTIDVSKYTDLIKATIEAILSTPQKKERK